MNESGQAVLDRILKPVRHHPNVLIAGGACVDFDKASDIDLFVTTDPSEWCSTAESFAHTVLRLFPFHALRPPKEGSYNNGTVGRVIGEAYDVPSQKMVQVIHSLATSPQALLEDFDISTHQVGYNLKIGWIYGAKHTPPTVAPVALKMGCFRRYVKICLRYGFTPDPIMLGVLAGMPVGEESHEAPKKSLYIAGSDDVPVIVDDIPL